MVRFLSFAVLVVGLFLAFTGAASAQQSPDDLLLQFQQRLQNEALGQGQDPSAQARGNSGAGQQTGQPQQPEQDFRPASQIELSYRKRLKALEEQAPSSASSARQTILPSRQEMSGKWSFELKQVGYDALYQENTPKLSGGVSDQYILGPGDKISVTLRGQVDSTNKVTVGRDGYVVLPNLQPIMASGRSFSDFRGDLEALVDASMVETKAFVSLSDIRQLSILVSGEVENPGIVSVTGLSSVVDALVAARGVRKTGTLRAVQVVRDGKTYSLDLYPVLLGIGEVGDLSLREGDRIVVPPIGPTVAVFAAVSRPGIYELKGNSIAVRSALDLAGGPLVAKGQRYIKFSVGSDGRGGITEQRSAQGTLHRGDLFGVIPRSEGTAGAFYLAGHVYNDGWRSLAVTPGVLALLNNRSEFRNGPYLPFIVIKRFNPYTQAPSFIPVNGSQLLRRNEEFALQDQDYVIILSQDDIRYLSSQDVRLVMNGSAPIYGRTTPFKEALNPTRQPVSDPSKSTQPAPSPNLGAAASAMQVCEGLRTLSQRVIDQEDLGAGQFNDSQQGLQNILPCPMVYDRYPDLLPYVLQNVMSLNGAVNRPGFYPVTDDAILADVLSTAGGPLGTADPQKVEVTSFQQGAAVRQQIPLALAQTDYSVGPHASVTLAEKFTALDKGSIILKGEVRYPGRYTLLRGERLSQVIERAGGFTDEAYIIGAVFLRKAVKDAEQKNYLRLAQEIEMAMPTALSRSAATGQGDSATEQGPFIWT